MHVKEIIRPEVRETFFYGKIISWKFNDSIVHIKARNKYCYRVTLIFESGDQADYQKGGFNTKAEAVKAKETAIAQLHNGEFSPYDYTAREFFDYWLYYYMVDVKDISYNTFVSYRNIIYNYLLKVIGKKYLQDLRSEDFVKALDTIKSPDVLRLAYGVLSGSFKYAQSNGYVSSNLVDSAISLHKTKRRGSRKDYAKEQKKAFRKKVKELTNVYSVEQISTLLYTCKKEEPTIFMAMLLAVTTGLRISETIAIKYQNIDFLNNKIYVESQLGRTITNDGIPGQSLLTQEKRTKTHNSVREVPIADFVVDEIILQRRHYEELKELLEEEFHDLGYLICQDNGLPWNRSFKDDAYKRVVDKCGFKFVQWRKLRTTYATVLAQYNVSMKAISSSLGHYSTDFTKEVYVKSKRKVIDLASMIKPFADEILYASEDSKSMEMPDVTNYYRI